jgi:hypothetical protein
VKSKKVVNIISELDHFRFLPILEKRYNLVEFSFSRSPIDADFHVIYHLKNRMKIRNIQENVAFVVTEPPEIEKIKFNYLNQFGTVLTPKFDYLKGLDNVRFGGGLIVHQAGFSFNETFVEAKLGLEKILNSWNNPRSILLSVITSNKTHTHQQRQRIKFIEYLSKYISNVEIYGRGFNEISDKSDILLRSKYHLALENSTHDGYWTEKFIDPLICGTQIFYAGDKTLKNVFKSLIEIDLNNFSFSKDKIIEAMDENIWQRNSELRYIDCGTYFQSNNLFAEIEKWVIDKEAAPSKTLIRIKAEYPSFIRKIWKKILLTRRKILNLLDC